MKRFRSLALAGAAASALTLAAPVQANDVSFMNWTVTEEGGREDILRLLASFNSATGLTAEPIGYAWGDMIRNTFLRARTNTLPDVSQVQARFLPTIANIEDIVDLNTVFDRAELEAMFDPGFLSFGEIDGRQVALPWQGGTIGMVANLKVLEMAGVEGIPETIDEFLAALDAVRDTIPNSVPYAMATQNNASILLDYLIWTWTFGGDVLVDGEPAVNSPEAVAALQFMVDLVANRHAAPEVDRPDSRRLFGQEASAFYFDAPSAKGFIGTFSGQGEDYLPFIRPMATPVLEAGNASTSIQWGHVLVMFGEQNANRESAAAQLMMHILGDEVLLDYVEPRGTLPSTRATLADARITDDTYLADWAAGAGAPRRNTVAALSNGAEVSDIIGEEVQAAILGQKSAQRAADDMQNRLIEAMANAE